MTPGIAMQLTNISRDVLEDARMGRRYIGRMGLWSLSGGNCAAAASAILQTISVLRQQSHDFWHSPINIIKSGAQGYCYLPPRARISIAVAARVYREIGVQLARQVIAGILAVR